MLLRSAVLWLTRMVHGARAAGGGSIAQAGDPRMSGTATMVAIRPVLTRVASATPGRRVLVARTIARTTGG